jgi:hypothetical protein
MAVSSVEWLAFRIESREAGTVIAQLTVRLTLSHFLPTARIFRNFEGVYLL